MINKLPSNVIAFANGNTELFDAFKDYWNQYLSIETGKKLYFSEVDKEGKPISYGEKEALLNGLFLKEIEKRSGVDFASAPLEQIATNPMVSWATFAVVSQIIDAVLPDTIINSIGAYTDVRVAGYGDSFRFQLKPRDLFTVSKAGRLGMREAEVHKQFDGEYTVVPEMRQITVGVSLYRVLAGLESLAAFTAKAIRSMETQMNVDAYTAFATAMAALPNTPVNQELRLAGYSQTNLTKLAQRVSSFSGGAAPIVMGTKVALATILPDDANYRYDLESEYVKIGYMRHAFGMDFFELPQVADWKNPFATVLDDSKLWIVAPGTDKLVKLCLEGSTISNVDETFRNATLQQDATMWKSWKAAVVTTSVAATIEL